MASQGAAALEPSLSLGCKLELKTERSGTLPILKREVPGMQRRC